MNPTQHTPGPYEIRPNTPGHCLRGTEHLFSVGQLRRDGEDSAFLTVAENMTEADAKFFAAAPELLAALEGLVVRYRAVRPQIFGTDTHEQQARAAIARAKPQPPP